MELTYLLKRIEKADPLEIDDLLDAVIRRKRILYPDWEIICYARMKGEEEDTKTLMDLLAGGREKQ